ncbi:MAG: hypothetical protein IKN85_00480, partial [Oscillospiraceae bacterium]|nr:hypothetical protein [Oscillospiraceae bacterium]
SGDMNTCNLVLGINEYLQGEDKNINNDFIEFKKFYQRIYKKTGCKYKEWLREFDEASKQSERLNILFYGHSLDVTDKDILRDLILHDKALITIYYRNRKSLGKLISNLVKIIGEDEVIRRTANDNQTIKFQPLEKNDSFDIVNDISYE